MLICENDPPEAARSSTSRVGESLRRLHRHLEQCRTAETRFADQFEKWQEKWSDRRDQIAQRLSIIDTQLEELVQSNRQKPHLSLVGE